MQTELNPQVAQKDRLLRILGVSFGVAVVVGGTIGVGILRTPGAIASLLASTWLIILIWIVGGLYTLLNANYISELATMLPKAGGPYVYARRAFGDYGGFVVGWSDWIGNITPMAYLPIAFAEFLAVLVPAITPYTKVIAVSLLLLFGILNWIGLRMGSEIQKLMSLLKALALIAFVVTCFLFGGQKTPQMIAPPANPVVTFILAFQLVIGTFGGWTSAIYFAEEDRNPAHNIPRSLFGGVILVIAIYLLVNIALLHVLPMSTLAVSKLAAADAMQQIFGSRGGQIVTILALLSLLSIINAVLMFVPRTLFALSRDGLFSRKAAFVNKGGTPAIALGISMSVAIILILTGTFEKLFAIYSFYYVSATILLICALFILRIREPDLPRPFKTWGYPYAPILLLLIVIALFIGFIISDTRGSLYASASIAISYPIYLLVKKYS